MVVSNSYPSLTRSTEHHHRRRLPAHRRRHAGRSRCWQVTVRKSSAASFSSPSQTTRLRNSPGPRPCSCLQAASQLLQPIQRSRSNIRESRLMFSPSPFGQMPPVDFTAIGHIPGKEGHGYHVDDKSDHEQARESEMRRARAVGARHL